MFKNNKTLQFLSSLKITVVCLGLLFVLTLWGTLYQVDHGIYYAQEKFFNSLFFPVWGFFPFPGARLVIWILFINLLAVTLTRFIHYRFKRIGILIIHFGLLTYFFGAFITFHLAEESYVHLMEGAGTNVSSSYHHWEVSVWKGEGEKRKVIGIDEQLLKKDQHIADPRLPFTIIVEDYFQNANAYTTRGRTEPAEYLNASGIDSLTRLAPDVEPEQNKAGILVRLKTETASVPVLLYGVEAKPTTVEIGSEAYNLQLRKKRFVLPMTIILDDFIAVMHPGTEMASEYKSWVTIDPNNVVRKVLIYMNHPLRYKEYTAYQASYAIDQKGREYSTFAVVRNPGRLLPYVSSLLVSAGLLIHFLGYAFRRKKHG